MIPPEAPGAIFFNLIARYFWAFIIVSQAALARREWKLISERHMHDPDRILRYRSLFRGFLFWANLPWVLIGFLILTGKVSDVFAFANPESIDIWVFLWLASLFLILIIGSFWIFLWKGAETLSAHPGVPYVPHISAGRIKIVWTILCLLVVGAVIFRLRLTIFGHFDVADYLAFFVPLVFIFFWMLISWITAMTGGWYKLVRHYEFNRQFDGRLLTTSGRMGMSNYGGILRLGANADGLYLSVVWVFRIGHPPLFIPWEDIRARQEGFLFFKYAYLRFNMAPNVKMRIPKSVALKLKERAGTGKALPEIQA